MLSGVYAGVMNMMNRLMSHMVMLHGLSFHHFHIIFNANSRPNTGPNKFETYRDRG